MTTRYEKLLLDQESVFHFQEFYQDWFTSPLHFHDEFEIIYISKSNGKLYIGNTITNFSEGELFLIAPGIPHCFYNKQYFLETSKKGYATVIQFKLDSIGKSFFESKDAYSLNELLKSSESGIRFNNPPKKLIRLLLGINKIHGLKRLYKLLMILDELINCSDYNLLTNGNLDQKTCLADSDRIKGVIQYVAENFKEDISLEEAASLAHMQKAAFCRFFKRKTKKKFMEFVNETRMAHAKKLILETDKSILEIAYESGYESASYFYRLFSNYYNTTPLLYRKNTRKIDVYSESNFVA